MTAAKRTPARRPAPKTGSVAAAALVEADSAVFAVAFDYVAVADVSFTFLRHDCPIGFELAAEQAP